MLSFKSVLVYVGTFYTHAILLWKRNQMHTTSNQMQLFCPSVNAPR